MAQDMPHFSKYLEDVKWRGQDKERPADMGDHQF